MPLSTTYFSVCGQSPTTVLALGAESHHVFDAGAVVPAAIEDDDLAGRRKPFDVALHEQLRLLAIRRRRQRDRAKDPRAYALGQGLDGAALAGGIAPLEHDDDARALRFDPILQMAELDLKPAQLLLVIL